MSRQTEEILRVIEPELEWSYSRSPGPGGQNVNKSNTQAHLRWEFCHSKIRTEIKDLISKSVPARFRQGESLILSSSSHRAQMQNKRACMKKLEGILEAALKRSTPRVATKVAFAKKLERREKKVHHSRKKQMRAKIKENDE